MITAPVGGRLRVIMQVAHQDQCGLLASAWGNAGFARPEPWVPIVGAAAAHDEGWRAWERNPEVLPAGEPRNFAAMDIEQHVAIHRASARAAHGQGERVGLLVGMHGCGLMMRRLGLDGAIPPLDERPNAVRVLVREQAAHARATRAGMGEGAVLAGWAWAGYRILQAIDLLSLYMTWRGLPAGEAWTITRVPRVPGDEAGVVLRVTPVDLLTCAVDPWPFGPEAVDAHVVARIIDDRPYAGACDLAAALDRAEPRVLPMRVVRA